MAAVSSQALKLCIIVEADNIRKITLDTRPESVDDLKSILKDKLKLDVDFSLQYEDPDFDGELISLVDIDELPQKATLKLFMAEVETSSISATDTELLSDVSSPERLSRWPPGIFPVPTFAYEVYPEFQRITNQNLPNIFYEELDRHTLLLMTLYRQRASKTGKTSDALADILRIHDLQVEDSDEPDVDDAPVDILTVVSDDTEKPIHFSPIKISIVLESEVMGTERVVMVVGIQNKWMGFFYHVYTYPSISMGVSKE
ncbi:UNVERIFIED_CONTAM: hypothetical protein FKN15_033549 [Acipenser sinensis]